MSDWLIAGSHSLNGQHVKFQREESRNPSQTKQVKERQGSTFSAHYVIFTGGHLLVDKPKRLTGIIVREVSKDAFAPVWVCY